VKRQRENEAAKGTTVSAKEQAERAKVELERQFEMINKKLMER